jgi:pyruvate,orthophosphate dikinase
MQQRFDFLPHAFSQLLETMRKIENEYRDMQDVEFTVERDELHMLQTRSGKRTASCSTTENPRP